MADQPLTGLRSAELKRRGIAAVRETLRASLPEQESCFSLVPSR